MIVSAITQQTQSSIPPESAKRGRLAGHSFSSSNIPGQLYKCAFPLLILAGLSNIPGANAGPLSYSACVLGCTTVAPPLFPACVTMCLAVLFLPTP